MLLQHRKLSTVLARQPQPGPFFVLAAARASRPRWCDQIPTPAENQLYPYSEHSCAPRNSHDFGKLFGDWETLGFVLVLQFCVVPSGHKPASVALTFH